MECKIDLKAIELEHKQRRKRLFKTSFLNNYLVVAATIILIVIILLAIFAPLIAPHNPDQLNLSNSLKGISRENFFGTDRQGRDIFSRILFGARTTLLGAVFVVIISNVIGIPLGLISGYYGGKIDNLVMRMCDIILAFPALLLAFVIVAVFGRNFTNSVIALGVVYVPMIARLVRSVTLVEKEKIYVEAARAIGISDQSIIFKHILVNCTSPILIQVTIDMAYSVLDLAAMSFLGLGVQPPQADWGYMLSEGREYLMLSPNVTFAAGFSIMITVICFNLFSDGLQVFLDPQQRRV
ncbi:MAG: ABC transporter permease [Tissierellales bacterium]|nr:ABC transporter permease [Tissierellales bacterium]MBN2827725.1 ABC transporter permease [Tissierellales bacterium]